MTTVRELIQDLLLLDSDLEVWVSSDAEGNGFKPLDGISTSYADEDGEMWGEDPDDEDPVSPNAVVIWPV
jgi:hypothetical protein